ncbi:MAG: TIGR01777 family oxidoreductase [Proteobacteria bacterium]|nr:TIGR01777 family oxidoreductase [Pseudomonadota bacterium]
MKFFITGASGFVGRRLIAPLLQSGHQVIGLSRGARESKTEGLSWVQGDPNQPGDWQAAVAEADVAINLAGANLFGRRWTEDYKKVILESRIAGTKNLVEALVAAGGRGKKLISTSAVGYYGFRGDEELDEYSPPGLDFLAMVCRHWESEAIKAEAAGVRVVRARFGIVLGRRGGALEQVVRPFRMFLGGPLGGGKQYFSWIHQNDLVAALLFLAENEKLTGPFNLTAPNPVTNRDLARAVGQALRKPSFIPTPAFVLRLALGEFGSVLVQGQRALPQRLTEAGFEFQFPQVDTALVDLLG